ncbi:esterase/lipase family protein [Modestobacter marinus]|uniref:esterase/lipase family protein n=1 Tax=Modestobacter marinus TaxID=477641 RepID=UPI001C972DC7|nr:alpha/beta fold hydrolase [Modestobacter marinus]
MSIGRPVVPDWVMGAHLAREVAEMAWAVLLLPWGATVVGDPALQPVHPEPAEGTTLRSAPVVLVHGYAGSPAAWWPLERELRRAGFTNVHAAAYNAMTTSLDDIARGLVAQCHEAMRAAGTDHLHVVGHSLGGVVVRYAVHRLGLARHVGTAVTVAAPHRGTHVASLGWGGVARALRPGSPVLEDLERPGDAVGVRWVAYYSDRDLIVGPDSARLDEDGARVVNVAVPDVGHLGVLRAQAFLGSVVRQLLAAEEEAGRPAPGLVAADPSAATVA